MLAAPDGWVSRLSGFFSTVLAAGYFRAHASIMGRVFSRTCAENCDFHADSLTAMARIFYFSHPQAKTLSNVVRRITPDSTATSTLSLLFLLNYFFARRSIPLACAVCHAPLSCPCLLDADWSLRSRTEPCFGKHSMYPIYTPTHHQSQAPHQKGPSHSGAILPVLSHV